MSVKYKLMKTYGQLPNNAEYKAVTIENLTVDLDRMARNIQGATALTHGDVVGTIIALGSEIVRELRSGNNVHLRGIGYFSIAVRGEVYEDPHTHHRRLKKPSVRTVRFRPDTEMMDALRYTEFENMTYRHGTTSVPSPQEIDTALDELFAEKPFITVDDLRRHLGLSTTNAYRIADRLNTEGRLHNIGSRYRKLYERGEKAGE